MISRRPRPRGSYQVTSHVAVILLLLVMFVSAGYYLLVVRPEAPGSDVAGLPALTSARQTWESRRPRSYRYVVERWCDCPAADREPFIVTEEGNAVTARFAIPLEAENGEMLTVPARSLSIKQLFYRIELAMQEGELIEANFDTTYGFPSMVRLDDAGQEALEIRDFEVIEYR